MLKLTWKKCFERSKSEPTRTLVGDKSKTNLQIQKNPQALVDQSTTTIQGSAHLLSLREPVSVSPRNGAIANRLGQLPVLKDAINDPCNEFRLEHYDKILLFPSKLQR
jgi:hypothetical protein